MHQCHSFLLVHCSIVGEFAAQYCTKKFAKSFQNRNYYLMEPVSSGSKIRKMFSVTRSSLHLKMWQLNSYIMSGFEHKQIPSVS